MQCGFAMSGTPVIHFRDYNLTRKHKKCVLNDVIIHVVSLHTFGLVCGTLYIMYWEIVPISKVTTSTSG